MFHVNRAMILPPFATTFWLITSQCCSVHVIVTQS
uniref:Uncharacterized protein n=1 Tax=Anguilla anguilla TaxID=7936 RepID=A0A0E9UHL2_ANGAN